MRTAVHCHTYICLCQSRCIIGSVTHHGNEFTVLLLSLDVVHLVLRLSLGNEIIHSRFLCYIFGSQRIVTSHHNCLHTHLMQALKTLTDSLFDDVLEFDYSNNFFVDSHYKRCTAVASYGCHETRDMLGEGVAGFLCYMAHGIKGSLANLCAVLQDDARRLRLSCKLNHTCTLGVQCPHLKSVVASQLYNRLSLGSVVGYRRKKACLFEFGLVHTFGRIERRSLTVAYGDCSCLVEQERIHIARCLHSLTALGNDIGTQGTIHTGDTNGRKQSADSGRYQTYE